MSFVGVESFQISQDHHETCAGAASGFVSVSSRSSGATTQQPYALLCAVSEPCGQDAEDRSWLEQGAYAKDSAIRLKFTSFTCRLYVKRDLT